MQIYFVKPNDGEWFAGAQRGFRHFITEDVVVTASEARFIAGDSYDSQEGVTGLVADYLGNKAFNRKQQLCLTLDEGRQSASVWAWNDEGNDWVSQDITLRREKLIPR